MKKKVKILKIKIFLKVNPEEKRNLGSFKNSPVHGPGTASPSKQKREVSYSIMDETNPEILEPNYQSDYEDLIQTMDDEWPMYFKKPEEKRYLGKKQSLIDYIIFYFYSNQKCAYIKVPFYVPVFDHTQHINDTLVH